MIQFYPSYGHVVVFTARLNPLTKTILHVKSSDTYY